MFELSIYSDSKKIYDSSEKKFKKSFKKLYNWSVLALIPIIEGGDIEKYIQEAPIESKNAFQIIADFCSSVIQFAKNIAWCISNPFKTLIIILEWFGPFILLLATLTPIIGLILYLFNCKEFIKYDTKSLIISPIIVLFIYVISLTILRSLA